MPQGDQPGNGTILLCSLLTVSLPLVIDLYDNHIFSFKVSLCSPGECSLLWSCVSDPTTFDLFTTRVFIWDSAAKTMS